MHTTIATLGQQHRTVLARLDEVEAAAPGHTATRREFLAFLGGEVEEHFGLEEEALFPVLARHPHLTTGPVAVMEAEHHEFRALIAELAAALRAPGAGRPDPVVRAIITLLRAHIDKEDHVLFPLAEALLTAAELGEVEARAAAREGAASRAAPGKR